MYMSLLGCCANEKKTERQKQPCGISTAISCSLLNKAFTVEGKVSWHSCLDITECSNTAANCAKICSEK